MDSRKPRARSAWSGIVLRSDLAGSRASSKRLPTPGRALLELAANRKHRTGTFFDPAGASEPSRVRLATDFLETAPPKRAWTIAHELSQSCAGRKAAHAWGTPAAG